LQEETDAYSSSRTLSRGVNPTAALFFAPYSSLTYMALPHGHYQCPCFLFFGEFRIKKTAW
ncbi:TPA: hypothetical protein ACWSAM_005233, partial [Escherichia coli]